MTVHQPRVQGGIRLEILGPEYDEQADELGRTLESLGDTLKFLKNVTSQIGVPVVVGISSFQDGVQQLRLGPEMMQDSRRCDSGFPGDLCEGRIPPAVADQHSLSHVKDESLALFTFDQQGVVRSHARHLSPTFGGLSETDLVNT